jgi:hypothetical protein
MMVNLCCSLADLKLYPKDHVDKRGKKTVWLFNVSPGERVWTLGHILRRWR